MFFDKDASRARQLHLRITPGALLLGAWLNYTDTQGLLPLAILCCVAHELGHILLLLVLRIPVSAMTLSAVGAELSIPSPLSWKQEFAVSIAGPTVNILLCLLAMSRGNPLLAGMNLALGLFNLLPVYSLDGGKALNALLNLLLGAWAGQRWNQSISAAVSVLILTAGFRACFLYGNLTMLLVGLWLFRRDITARTA